MRRIARCMRRNRRGGIAYGCFVRSRLRRRRVRLLRRVRLRRRRLGSKKLLQNVNYPRKKGRTRRGIYGRLPGGLEAGGVFSDAVEVFFAAEEDAGAVGDG